MDHLAKFWNFFYNIFWPFQVDFSNVLFDQFPSKLSLTTNHLLKMLLKMVHNCSTNPCVWCFLDDSVTLGFREHHLHCTHWVF